MALNIYWNVTDICNVFLYVSIKMIKYIDRSLNLPNKSESVSTLRYNPSARMDTDSRRIPFSLHFGQLRASNYRGTSRGFELRPDRYSRVHAKHVSDIAAACFSFSVPPRPPGNDVIRHCRFHCDSRIAVHYLESANSAVLDCASVLRHSNSAVLLLALISESGIHKFQEVYEDPLDAYRGTIKGSRRGLRQILAYL